MGRQIEASELWRRLNAAEDLKLLDVREIIEFHTFNIGGVNVPLATLSEKLVPADYNKNDEIIVICKIGLRSETAVRLLSACGYTNVRNLTGGLVALRKIENQHI